MRSGSFSYVAEAPASSEADVLERTDHSLHMTARQAPSTTVDNRTTVTPVDGGVRVEVQITLSAPTLLFAYAFRQARAAHLELGARIARSLGAPV